MDFQDKRHRTRHVFKKENNYSVNEIINTPLSFDKSGALNQQGLKELYSHLSIYRNKFYETFRYIIIDNDSRRIIDHLAVSLGKVNKSVISLKNKHENDNNVFMNALFSYIRKNDYSLVIAHNHPSGNIEPSNQDMVITSKIELAISSLGEKNKFLGHIILDHGKFSYYTPKHQWLNSNGEYWKEFNTGFENKNDPLLKKNISSCFKFQVSDKNVKQLALIAQDLDAKENWNIEHYTPIFGLNSNLVPVLLKFIENKELCSIALDLKNKNLFGEFDDKNIFNDFNENLIKTSQRFGCVGFIPIALNKKVNEALNIISRENIFIDAVVKQKDKFVRLTELYPDADCHFPILTKDIIETREHLSKKKIIPFFEKSYNFKKSYESKTICAACNFIER